VDLDAGWLNQQSGIFLQLQLEDIIMLSPITHFLPITTIRRERLLPVQGRVIVRKGQKVSATDTIAEAMLAPQHIVLEVARGLGVPANKADAALQFQAGEEISEGDLVAGPIGIGRRVIRSPRSGKVVVAGGGQVLIEVESQPFELKAGIPGPGYGIVHRSRSRDRDHRRIDPGLWGNGNIDFGLLTVLMEAPNDFEC
jgi:hypothetical protein